MTIHVKTEAGKAKCGAKSYGFYSRIGLYFANENFSATCKRCLGQSRKPVEQIIEPPENWESLIFHRQFGGGGFWSEVTSDETFYENHLD